MDMFVLGLCECMILFGVDCDEATYGKTKSLVIYHSGTLYFVLCSLFFVVLSISFLTAN